MKENLSEEKKEKKRQYGRGGYKIFPEDKKAKISWVYRN